MKSNPNESEAKLTAYVLGELNDTEVEAIEDRLDADAALRDEVSGFETDGGTVLGQHTYHQVDVHIERIDRCELDFPALVDKPLGQLFCGNSFAAMVGVADKGHTWLDNVEIAAFEIAHGDHVIDGHVIFQVKTQRRGILAASPRIRQLTNDRTVRRHK